MSVDPSATPEEPPGGRGVDPSGERSPEEPPGGRGAETSSTPEESPGGRGVDPSGERSPTTPLDADAVSARLRAARGIGQDPPRRQASATLALVAVIVVTGLFVLLAVWYVSG